MSPACPSRRPRSRSPPPCGLMWLAAPRLGGAPACARSRRPRRRDATVSLPTIVSREEWLAARKELLAREKELTREREPAQRRAPAACRWSRSPRTTVRGAGRRGGAARPVRGPPAAARLPLHVAVRRGRGLPLVLVPGRQHRPRRAPPRTRHLARHRVARAVRRARRLPPADGLAAAVPLLPREHVQLRLPRHLDRDVAPLEYNFEDRSDDPAYAGWKGELPGTSAFLRDGDRVFHTYSSYARGGDLQLGTYTWLDLTALGRQESWEEPPGRSDGPFMSWVRRHDEYPQSPTA